MFKKIIVPLDRSPLSEQALAPAAAIARASKARMDVVLVHEAIPLGGFEDIPWNEADWGDDTEYLNGIAAELTSGAGLSVTPTTARGFPVTSICRHVQDTNADLVVMTSHGRTGFSRAWLGSVAGGVLRHAHVPVLVLRPSEAAPVTPHPGFRHILVTLDGSALAMDVLAPALELARASHAKITLCRVVQPVPLVTYDAFAPFATMPSGHDVEATARIIDTATRELTGIATRIHEREKVDVDTRVVVDPRVAHAILEVAHDVSADVIAMATHGRGLSRLVFGSVADKVIRAASVAMLVYRPATVREPIPRDSAVHAELPLALPV